MPERCRGSAPARRSVLALRPAVSSELTSKEFEDQRSESATPRPRNAPRRVPRSLKRKLRQASCILIWSKLLDLQAKDSAVLEIDRRDQRPATTDAALDQALDRRERAVDAARRTRRGRSGGDELEGKIESYRVLRKRRQPAGAGAQPKEASSLDGRARSGEVDAGQGGERLGQGGEA